MAGHSQFKNIMHRKGAQDAKRARVFAKIAREEGFAQIAVAFERIAIAEKQHGKRYKDLAGNLEEGRVFARNGTATWRCINCGYLHEAAQAPQLCPACLHPQSYFELLGENW